MRVIKYMCDCCKQEVEEETKLYPINLLDRMSFMNSGDIRIDKKEICIGCLDDMAYYYDNISKGNRM